MFIRGDLLLPGDVLLSRGVDKESDWIARATFGPYSHAAIYHSNYCVFESIDDGVGFSKLDIAKVCTKDNRRSVLLDVSKYRKLEIQVTGDMRSKMDWPSALSRKMGCSIRHCRPLQGRCPWFPLS
jgi:hypothetical protein